MLAPLLAAFQFAMDMSGDPSASAYNSTVAHTDEEISALSELFNIYVQVETGSESRFVYCPLPTEILETIFILCARNYYYHSERRGDPTPTPSWVNVSYVCRQWCDVALNCATLWTYLFLTSRRWTEELLARSKQASLKLNVNLLYRNSDYRRARFFEQVIPHLERIQDLRLYICRPDYDAFLSQLSLHTPRLEHLEILMEGFPTESSSPSLVPFDGDTPALRTLELVDCPVPWYSLKLTALTTLNLRHIPAQCQQSTPDFLATLHCMPNLQHLHLHNSLAPAVGFLSSAAFYSFQKISLPHLSQLLINTPVSTMVALLSCTNIPLETRVKLGPDCLADNISPVDAYTPLYSLLAQRYSTSKDQTLSSLTIRSLGIQCHMKGQVILHFGTLEDPTVSVPYWEWPSDLPLQIILSLYQPTLRDNERLISRTCCCIPMSNIQSIHVTYPPTSSTFWTDVLGHCPDLRHIRLSDGYMPNLASPLSVTPQDCTEDQDGSTDRGQSHILAPALEKLELYNISFSPRENESVEVADLQSLCDMLTARKEPRGRLIVTLGSENISGHLQKNFAMEGYWGGGHFHRVYYKEDYRDR